MENNSFQPVSDVVKTFSEEVCCIGMWIQSLFYDTVINYLISIKRYVCAYVFLSVCLFTYNSCVYGIKFRVKTC